MNHEPIEIDRIGAVALLRMAGPNPLNPLTDALVDALGAALRQVDADASLKASVLFGSAKAFAAGADIATMATLSYAEAFAQDYIGRNWETIRTRRKPMIAAVAGYALGGGCELAMMCDIVVAADNAVFGQPEIRLGIVPGAGGTQRLPRAVGKSMAMDMCLTGRSLTATEALASGLIARVVAIEQLRAEALRVAQDVARHSLPVVLAIKEAVDRSFESPLSDGLLFERRLFQAGFSLADQKEGMQAFLDKRPAQFIDR
jgi:enoyl-CoA hydratase